MVVTYMSSYKLPLDCLCIYVQRLQLLMFQMSECLCEPIPTAIKSDKNMLIKLNVFIVRPRQHALCVLVCSFETLKCSASDHILNVTGQMRKIAFCTV